MIREKLPGIAITLPLVLFIVCLPRYTDTAKIWYMILILSGFIYLVFNPGQIRLTSTVERIFLCTVLLNFLWITFCYYVNGAPERGESLLWGRHFYFAFLVFLFFLFRQIEIPDRYILLSLACGVAVSFVDIMIDLIQGVDHRQQGMNPNSFAPIQISMFWTLLFYFLWEKKSWLKIIGLIGFSLALVNIVASGSKTAWLSFLLTAIFFIFYLAPISTTRKILTTLALVTASSSLYFIPYVNMRLDDGFDSINRYFTLEEHADHASLGTFGIRVELWKEAYHVFLDRPLVGAGLGGVKPMVEANRERYQTNELAAPHKYVHNQYLSALATRGFPGLVFFLAILILPVYIAMSTKSRQRDKRVASLSLVCIFLVYAFGNIFESYFEAKSAIMFTSIMLPLWLARLSTAKDRQSEATEIT